MPEPTTQPAADPNQPKPRCRAIKTDGHRCKNPATWSGHLCWPHAHHRNPVLPDPSHVVVPLLEDHASVQLVLSQVAHGLLTHKLEVDRARALIQLCQVASFTLPRPPRMPTPKPDPPDPMTRATQKPETAKQELGTNNRGLETDNRGLATDNQQLGTNNWGLGTSSGPWPDEWVHRLALDYEGIICGDGDLPAPSAHWQPASPEATAWDIIHAAPNQSRPTPISPFEPETHDNCTICQEIRRLQGNPVMHPHLQPVVNPYCKSNQPGCQGPTSDFRCLACDDRYHSNRRRYDRARIRQTRDSNLREEPADPDSGSTSPGSSVSSAVKDSPTASGPRFRPRTDPNTGNDADYDPRLRLPNPIPEQFPDDDPMLRGYIPLDDKLDLKASADPAFPPGSSLPAVCSPRPVPCTLWAVATREGNTQNLLPSNPCAINKTNPSLNRGGTPRRPSSH